MGLRNQWGFPKDNRKSIRKVVQLDQALTSRKSARRAETKSKEGGMQRGQKPCSDISFQLVEDKTYHRAVLFGVDNPCYRIKRQSNIFQTMSLKDKPNVGREMIIELP